MDEGIRQLCRLSLIDPEVKEWLARQVGPAPHELGDGGKLLEKILQSPLALHQPPARAAFISTLTPQEEIAINLLDLDRPQENTVLVAQAPTGSVWPRLTTRIYARPRRPNSIDRTSHQPKEPAFKPRLRRPPNKFLTSRAA